MFTGVSGGLAEYFDVDPVLVRVAWVVLCFVTFGFAILLYIIMAIVMPREESIATGKSTASSEHGDDTGDSAPQASQVAGREEGRRRNLFALAIICLGGLLLLSNLGVWWFSWGVLWPVVLIGLGAFLLIGRSKSA